MTSTPVTSAPWLRPLLEAPTPQAWLDTHLERHFAVHEVDGAEDPGLDWVGPEDLLADDAAPLVAAHARILADGGTPQMAAKWLVAWTAGSLADAVGFLLATGAAGVLADTGRVRWRRHPGGWVDRARPEGCTVLVTDGHPWAGQPGVEVVATEDEVVARTVDALVRVVRPVVDGVRRTARVGARALWAEVADGIGMSPTYQPHLPVREDVVERLRAALTAPGVPWRVSPTVRTASAPWGPAYVGQKGGCCLAYQRPDTSEPVAEADLTPGLRAYRALFPPETGAARVCATCSLRDPQGCADRQLWWLQQRHDA